MAYTPTKFVQDDAEPLGNAPTLEKRYGFRLDPTEALGEQAKELQLRLDSARIQQNTGLLTERKAERNQQALRAEKAHVSGVEAYGKIQDYSQALEALKGLMAAEKPGEAKVPPPISENRPVPAVQVTKPTDTKAVAEVVPTTLPTVREVAAEKAAEVKAPTPAAVPPAMTPAAVPPAETPPAPAPAVVPAASVAVPPVAPVVPAAPVAPAMPVGRPSVAATENVPEETEAEKEAYNRALLGQALIRATEGFSSAVAGRDLRSGAADMLGERMKMLEALREKRMSKAEADATERQQNNAYLDALIKTYPDRKEKFEALRNVTGKPNFRDLVSLPANIALQEARRKSTEAGIPLTEAKVGQVQAATAAIPEKAELGKGKLAETIRHDKRTEELAEARNVLAARRALNIPDKGTLTPDQKATDKQLAAIGRDAKEFIPIVSGLQQADEAFAELGGQSPSVWSKVASVLPGGERLLTKDERKYYAAVTKLKQFDQLAMSGKVLAKSEQEEFRKLYGTSWYSDPAKAKEAVEYVRNATRKTLDSRQAQFRASPVGAKALEAYEASNGITPNHPALRSAAPKAAPAGGQTDGLVTVKHSESGRIVKVPRATANEILKDPAFEEVR